MGEIIYDVKKAYRHSTWALVAQTGDKGLMVVVLVISTVKQQTCSVRLAEDLRTLLNGARTFAALCVHLPFPLSFSRAYNRGCKHRLRIGTDPEDLLDVLE